MATIKKIMLAFLLFLPALIYAQRIKIVTNHVGYEDNLSKRAVIVADSMISAKNFQLVNTETGKTVFSGPIVYSGKVDKWKNYIFWTIDFSKFIVDGTYQLQISVNGKNISSYPFKIEKNILERFTLSDVVYYFKGQRSSGLLDKADHQLSTGKLKDSIDAHGGWYDATGDYGKHLSHLTFSTYFNPQQISLTVYGLLKTYRELIKRKGTDYRQYNRRILDEAMYGADYLARVQAPGGSFYRSVSAPGPGKFAKDRNISAESKGYTIKKNKDQSFGAGLQNTEDDWRSYQCSYRSGAGIAIAALALASTFDTCGDYSNADYLHAAENAFAFLEKAN